MERERIYGIDLLKIIAMFFVIVHHAIYWAGWGLGTFHGGVKGWTMEWLDSLCLCAVNCFVLATGWVMCRLGFKFQRIVKLWCEVVFYSLAIALVGKLFFTGNIVGFKQWVQAVLPVRSNSYWFFTQYFVLFFLMPVLNQVLRTTDERRMKMFILGGGRFALGSPIPVEKGCILRVWRI